jgi:hypothetical protein
MVLWGEAGPPRPGRTGQERGAPGLLAQRDGTPDQWHRRGQAAEPGGAGQARRQRTGKHGAGQQGHGNGGKVRWREQNVFHPVPHVGKQRQDA